MDHRISIYLYVCPSVCLSVSHILCLFTYLELAKGHEERLQRPVTLYSLRQKSCVFVLDRYEQWPWAMTCNDVAAGRHGGGVEDGMTAMVGEGSNVEGAERFARTAGAVRSIDPWRRGWGGIPAAHGGRGTWSPGAVKNDSRKSIQTRIHS